MALESIKGNDYLRETSDKIERNLTVFFDELRSHPALADFNRDDLETAVLRPAQDAVIASGGKRLRPIFAHLSHDLCGGRGRDIERIALAPELFHKGSVVVDDIEDHAPFRKNPLHAKYDQNIALNAGNFLYFMPQLLLESTSYPPHIKLEMVGLINRSAVTAHAGQALDLHWTKRTAFSSLPTEDQYLSMVNAKTGSVFELCAALGGTSAGAPQEKIDTLRAVAQLTGIAYQLRDDLLSLREGSADYGEDIAEGKVTLDLIYLAQHEPEAAQRIYAIQQSRSDKTKDDIDRAVAILKDRGAVAYVEQKIAELAQLAKQRLHSKFSDSDHRRALESLIDTCVSRDV